MYKLSAMENIIIIPQSEKQSSVIKAFLEEMKIHFKVKNDNELMSEDEFYAKIDKSIKQSEEGKVQHLTSEFKKELFKSIL